MLSKYTRTSVCEAELLSHHSGCVEVNMACLRRVPLHTQNTNAKSCFAFQPKAADPPGCECEAAGSHRGDVITDCISISHGHVLQAEFTDLL